MTTDMLSQEEIDALLKGDIEDEEEKNLELTHSEKDALGEIGNISMGTAATTLFTLLGQKVKITTPKVMTTSIDKLSLEHPVPFVAVDVKYKIGLSGANLLILKIEDVKVITDLMMGGDGTNVEGELSEMDLSAISEAMNQMVGSSCTSLSEIFSKKIDIKPPKAFKINFMKDNLKIIDFDEPIVKISFRIIVGDIMDSQIMQLIPLSFAKRMASQLLDEPQSQQNEDYQTKKLEKTEQIEVNDLEREAAFNEAAVASDHYRNDSNKKESNKQPVNVRKVEFQSFDSKNKVTYKESIELIKEVPIEITVELGRTTKRISEILEYGPGTIIELDKLVGEPLDILANGKYIAKGEVVVIDDNFGIRVTDIINPAKRVDKL